jgi:hypothetical protein
VTGLTTGDMGLTVNNTQLIGDVAAASLVSVNNSVFLGNVTLSGTIATCKATDFGPPKTFTFSGGGGTLNLDGYSSARFLTTGQTLAGGKALVNSTVRSAVISVTVPATAAGTVDLDVDVTGTTLDNLTPNQPVWGSPLATVQQGADTGWLIGVRYKDAHTMTATFLAVLTGGNAVSFSFGAG